MKVDRETLLQIADMEAAKIEMATLTDMFSRTFATYMDANVESGKDETSTFTIGMSALISTMTRMIVIAGHDKAEAAKIAENVKQSMDCFVDMYDVVNGVFNDIRES